jgi:molybdopterin molybdotransferase
VTALDDCFAFPERRLLHEEAIDLLKGLASPLCATEEADIFRATGRVSAEAITAPRAIPAHTNAAVDGYAFAFRDYDPEKGVTLPVMGRAAAGGPLPAPEARGAIRIFTGAMMPEVGDTVAMQEDCSLEDLNGIRNVHIPGGLKRGANRRLAGEDLAKDAAVIGIGDRLRPQDAAALAACGRSRITCFRMPRVCIFSTGNEVLAPGASFSEGQVYDSNAPMLAGLFAALGITCTFGGILPDDRKAVHAALQSAAAENDLIITSGGASLGEEDHVVAALREAEALSLWQLAIKPGRPMGVGKIGSCLCFALPGNPVAVFVCALLYVWPVVRRLGGEPWREPPYISLPAGFEIVSRKKGRREFFRGWLEHDGETALVRKYERDGSGLISSLRASSGLIEIPETVASIAVGDHVRFIPFSALGIF